MKISMRLDLAWKITIINININVYLIYRFLKKAKRSINTLGALSRETKKN